MAVPCVSADDVDRVEHTMYGRREMKRVRVVSKDWRPKLRDGDHCHIYDTKNSFRY